MHRFFHRGVRSGEVSTGLSRPGRSRRRREGVALILVMCTLFLLTLVIFGLAQRLNEQVFDVRRDNLGLEAKALAYSGLSIALHPQVTVKTPALRHQVDKTHRYEARLTGEGGKINLNWLLAGEDPRKVGVLKSYLEAKGLDVQQTETLVDSLLDWIVPDNLPHLNGSETTVDGSPVPNRPFQDLAEIRRVNGCEPLVSIPHWEDDFTLLSRGPIDLQWASEEVVGALPRVGQARARVFVQQRRGEDGLDGTADDRILPTPDSAAQFLGLAPNDFQTMQDLVTLNDSTMHITSAGQAGDVIRTFEVVVRKEGMQPQFLLWKEY